MRRYRDKSIVGAWTEWKVALNICKISLLCANRPEAPLEIESDDESGGVADFSF